mgnify:FL=1
MEQLTVQDIIKQAGGIELINNTGIASNNKYMVHAEDCINEQLSHAHALKLNQLPPLDILEIGTGAGFFPFISKLYGHNVDSCDDRYPDSLWEDGYQLLNIDPKNYFIYKNVSIGNTFGQKFDMIVSFRSTIGTTTYVDPPAIGIDVWSVDEWKFFFKDCSKYLLKSNNSFMYFQCNKGCALPPYVNMHADEISTWGSKDLGEFFSQYQNNNIVASTHHFYITKEQIDNL